MSDSRKPGSRGRRAALTSLALVTAAISAAAGAVCTATAASAAVAVNAPPVGIAATSDGGGYWLVAADGGVFSFGDAAFYGSMGGKPLNQPVVGIAATPDGKGYWEVAADGGIFNFGDAAFYGSMGGKPLNQPVVGIAATPDGKGYWEVAADGGIFNFGDAAFYGSMGGKPLNQPVVGIAATPDGKGYWEVAADGGIFNFGDAAFYGSMGGKPLNQPVVGIAATPDGKGYREVAADGGIFDFGDAGFHGSMAGKPLNGPVVGLASDPSGGYWMTAKDGGVFAFGAATYYGRVVYTAPASPPTPVPSGNAASLAQQILNNSRITRSGRDVTIDLQDTAAGRVASAGAPLSAALLRLIVAVGQSHTLDLSALESGGTGHCNNTPKSRCPTDPHYTGDAVDIDRLDGHAVTGRNPAADTIITIMAPLMPYGSRFGQRGCPGTTPPLPAGIGQIADTCNHLHVDVPRSSS